MTSVHLLIELLIVLGTAALITVVFQRLRLPVVLGYVLAGLVIGPNVPVPLVADPALVHELSELGVILLMFTIGLELPLKTIARLGVPGVLTALFEVGLVIAVGTLVARLAGFDPTTAVFAGACLGISSTMLVAKAFDELGWKGGFTEVVFSILVFEDVIAIVLLAVVSAVASGAGLDGGELAALLGRLAGFLAAMLAGGLLIVPRAVRWVATRARRETLAIVALALCFAGATLAASEGFSVALGAFLAGVLVAESGHGEQVFSLVEVFRDVFAMVFFVSVGMSIDPALLLGEAPRILVFAVVVLACKPLGVAIGVFLAGHGVRPAVRAGVSLAQIGEFSFVIAGVLGNATLLAIAVGVSCVTTVTAPLLTRRSEQIAGWTEARLPRRIATFVAFYEAWLAGLRGREASTWRRHRRTIGVLVLDATIVCALTIAISTAGRHVLDYVGVVGPVRSVIQLAAVIVGATPFALRTVRRVTLLAHQLAVEAFPLAEGVDIGYAPRQALVATFEIAFALAIVVPVVAIVQPFVPGSFAVLSVVAGAVVLVMRRSIADFDGHLRASSNLVLELLATPRTDDELAQVATILPGFAGTVSCRLAETSAAVGRSLAELDLRARTGVTVLAIMRGAEGIVTPSPAEPLQAGDVLALAGPEPALAAARELLGAA